MLNTTTEKPLTHSSLSRQDYGGYLEELELSSCGSLHVQAGYGNDRCNDSCWYTVACLDEDDWPNDDPTWAEAFPGLKWPEDDTLEGLLDPLSDQSLELTRLLGVKVTKSVKS